MTKVVAISTKRVMTSTQKKLIQYLLLEVLDSARLTEDGAGKVILGGSQLQEQLVRVLHSYSRDQKFSHEQTKSKCRYPISFEGICPIEQQILVLSELFNLDPESAMRYAMEELPQLKLPEGAEDWVAIPRFQNFSQGEDDLDDVYTTALIRVYDELGARCPFTSNKNMVFSSIFQNERKKAPIAAITMRQSGEILILPAQLGQRYRGMSNRRAEALFEEGEFALGLFEVLCIALTSPSLFAPSQHQSHLPLCVSCPGDLYVYGYEKENPCPLIQDYRDKWRVVNRNGGQYDLNVGVATGFVV